MSVRNFSDELVLTLSEIHVASAIITNLPSLIILVAQRIFLARVTYRRISFVSFDAFNFFFIFVGFYAQLKPDVAEIAQTTWIGRRMWLLSF